MKTADPTHSKVQSSLWSLLRRIGRITFLVLGGFAFLLLVLSFTRIPYDVHRWLGTHKSHYAFYPDEIIFLGGSGMPSEGNLVRIYHVAKLSRKYPQARILIAHPIDVGVMEEIEREMVLHGIDSSKVDLQITGTNTHEQAIHIARDYSHLLYKHVLLVTSPESMLRSVATFRKAGFTNIGGHPADEKAMFVDLDYDFRTSGGKKYAPDVSGNMALRYNFWNYLKLEITCMREFVALAYYRLNGWI